MCIVLRILQGKLVHNTDTLLCRAFIEELRRTNNDPSGLRPRDSAFYSPGCSSVVVGEREGEGEMDKLLYR